MSSDFSFTKLEASDPGAENLIAISVNRFVYRLHQIYYA